MEKLKVFVMESSRVTFLNFLALKKYVVFTLYTNDLYQNKRKKNIQMQQNCYLIMQITIRQDQKEWKIQVPSIHFLILSYKTMFWLIPDTSAFSAKKY